MNRFMSEAIREARLGISNQHGGPFGCIIIKNGVQFSARSKLSPLNMFEVISKRVDKGRNLGKDRIARRYPPLSKESSTRM